MSDDQVGQLRHIGSVAARLCVMVLGAYQRDNDAAMRAFGSNGAAHVANELGGLLMRFKIQYPPEEPAE